MAVRETKTTAAVIDWRPTNPTLETSMTDGDNTATFAWPVDEGRPAREVWYGLVTLPERPLALWFRYTLLSTTAGHREARCWAAVTDGNGTYSRLGTRAVDATSARLSVSPFSIWVPDVGTLSNDGAKGRIDTDHGPIGWDLSWTPDDETFTPLRSRRLTTLATRVLGTGRHWSANQSIRVSGTVSVDDREFELAAAPGHQGHTVGRQTPDRWHWVHCNAFDVDDLVLEALDLDGRLTVCLRTPDRTHRLNRLHHVVGPWANETTDAGPGRWTFRGRGDGVALRAHVEATDDHWQLARYRCPDGSDRYNAHCSLASVDVEYATDADGDEAEWRSATSSLGRAEWVDTAPPVEGTYRPTEFAID